MRDHRLAFLEPRPFIRWRTTQVINFCFSKAAKDDSTDPEVYIIDPGTFTSVLILILILIISLILIRRDDQHNIYSLSRFLFIFYTSKLVFIFLFSFFFLLFSRTLFPFCVFSLQGNIQEKYKLVQ